MADTVGEDIHDLFYRLLVTSVPPASRLVIPLLSASALHYLLLNASWAAGFSGENLYFFGLSPEPAINAQMLKPSRKHYVVAVASKLGYFQLPVWFCKDIDLLITDTGATDEQSELKAAGLRIHLSALK